MVLFGQHLLFSFKKGVGNIAGGIGYYDNECKSIIIGGNSRHINDLFIDVNDVKWLATTGGLMKIYYLNQSQVFRIDNSGLLSNDI